MRMRVPARGVARTLPLLGLCLGVLLAAGCATRNQAVVEDRSPPGARPARGPVVAQPAPVPGAPAVPEARTYTVKKGDTLYFIALDHGHDYKDIAAWNNLDNPDHLSVGQVLRMSPPQGAAGAGAGAAPVGTAQVGVVVPHQPVEARPLGAAGTAAAAPPTSGTGAVKTAPKTGKEAYSEQAANAAVAPAGAASGVARKPEAQAAKTETKPESDDDAVDWGWPARGKLLGGFSEATNKGVDIAGKVGDPVIASASGKVIFSGTQLRGYGKLIIIKHNANYLSAYAHNNEILVREGQTVIKGQKIAEVGSTDAEQPMLHFEIRKLGKPVDPLKYLPAAS